MNQAMPAIRGLVGAASILVVGIVIGIASTRMVHNSAGGVGHVVVSIGSGAAQYAVLQEITDRLSLTPDQVTRIQVIISSSQGSVDTAWSAVREHLEQATVRMIADIEAELDEDQRELLRAWVVERHGDLPGIDSIFH